MEQGPPTVGHSVVRDGATHRGQLPLSTHTAIVVHGYGHLNLHVDNVSGFMQLDLSLDQEAA